MIVFLSLFEMINDVRDPHSIGVLKGNIRRNIKVYGKMERLKEKESLFGLAEDIVCGRPFYYSYFFHYLHVETFCKHN